MKLLAYVISGNTLGVDVESWDDTELNNNKPLLIINDDDSIPENYNDISSIINWGNLGVNIDDNLSFIEIRNEIKKLLTNDQISGNTTGLSNGEIHILNEYIF